MKLAALAVACVAALVPSVDAQIPVNRLNLQERLIVVVPIVGSGTYADPRRPLFAPASAKDLRKPGGIVSYSWEPTDDGKHAIVEFVARSKAALRTIANDPRVVKKFEKGKDKFEDVEKELKKLRKDYRLDKNGRAK